MSILKSNKRMKRMWWWLQSRWRNSGERDTTCVRYQHTPMHNGTLAKQTVKEKKQNTKKMTSRRATIMADWKTGTPKTSGARKDKKKKLEWRWNFFLCFSAGEKVVGLLQASTTLKMAEFLFLGTSTRYLTMRYVCAARGKASPQTNFT